MATSQYMLGRKKYQRPQAMLWADNPGLLSGGVYIPDGYEVGTDFSGYSEEELAQITGVDSFIILSDDNRSEIQFDINRIEKRERMVNGHMRSYHIADQLSISTSWDMLPSRSFKTGAAFNSTTGAPGTFGFGLPTQADQQFTTDGGAGGVELLEWYKNHKGSFWVYLAYDKYSNFESGTDQYQKLQQYNQIVEVYITDFKYSVQKRAGLNHDFWNISVTLEEV